MRQRRAAASNGLGTGLSTTIKYVRLSCSSVECPSPDAAASHRRRKRSKHRPERHDQVSVTHRERRRGQRPRNHNQVRATRKERRRGQRPAASAETIKYVRRTASGAVGCGLGATIKYLRRTRNGAAGNGMGTTVKYLRQTTAASSGECPSPVAAASRGRRQRSKHLLERHDQVPSTCDKQLPQASAWVPRLSSVPSVFACSK
jgi:hypothetical protein